MAKIKVPYYKQAVEIEINDKNLKRVLVSKAHEYESGKTESRIIIDAMENPIGSERLEILARGKKDMVIITSDHTRPVPSSITLPLILSAVRSVNPEIDITIAISTGSHRDMTKEEMTAKFGADLVAKEKFFMHHCNDPAQMVSLGILDTGLNAEVNRVIVETELLIAEGFIEPHFFAGFSGGRKSVFPGMASLDCIRANHCAEYIASGKARTGMLDGNPIHNEATEMARLAKLSYILNVVLDGDKKIIKAFAGDFEKAHRAGCDFVTGLSSVQAAPADIVVTTNGGYPLDQNIYQSVKGMTAAEAVCREGGVIIMIASCSDGHGGDSFYKTFKNASSPEEVTASIINTGRTDTVIDQWQSQILARVLTKCRVIMVTDMCEKDVVETFMMKHAENFDEALETAYCLTSPDASVTVISDGVSVIVTKGLDL